MSEEEHLRPLSEPPVIKLQGDSPVRSAGVFSPVYRGVNTVCGAVLARLLMPLTCTLFAPTAVVPQGNVGVVLKFGRYLKTVHPGTYVYNPCTEQYVVIPLQTLTMDIDEQMAVTQDNLTVEISAVVYYRVQDACKAIFCVEHYGFAVENMAQCLLRQVIGEHTLDTLFSDRLAMNQRITNLIDEATDPWGIKVLSVEIKDIKIPSALQRATAAVAEASRDGEARVINAQGQLRAATTMKEAADTMLEQPMSLQLRWFETLRQIGTEKNSTLIVPDSVSSMLSQMTSMAQFAQNLSRQHGRDKGGSSGAIATVASLKDE